MSYGTVGIRIFISCLFIPADGEGTLIGSIVESLLSIHGGSLGIMPLLLS
jgi:hypothetical protein